MSEVIHNKRRANFSWFSQISLVSSFIFRVVDKGTDNDSSDVFYGKNGVVWVLRFGGLCTLAGFVSLVVWPFVH